MRSVLFCVVAGMVLVGCGESSEGQAEILPHLSPIQLGKFWPQGDETPEPGNRDRTPYEFVLLLQSTGDADLVVDRVCVGGSDNFELEGPVPATIPAGDQGAVRITYIRNSPGADNAAIVVRSNAGALPELVVPLCAQVVADGEDKTLVNPCEITDELASQTISEC